jgi:type II secretory pathway pseudopilin PulG
MTAIEIGIVLAIVSILASLAYVNFRTMLNRSRVDSAAELVASAVEQCRGLAQYESLACQLWLQPDPLGGTFTFSVCPELDACNATDFTLFTLVGSWDIGPTGNAVHHNVRLDSIYAATTSFPSFTLLFDAEGDVANTGFTGIDVTLMPIYGGSDADRRTVRIGPRGQTSVE